MGLSVTLLGIVVSFSLYGYGIEEKFGLSLLYNLRGIRTPPADVLIVAINEESAEKLNQSNKLTNWSRSVHAQLTETLARAGARVIAYDVFFDEPSEAESDERFATAINEAKNVVLAGRLSKESEVKDEKGNVLSGISSQDLIPPIPILNDAAVGMAPFCLPTVSVEVRQCWTFKKGAGDVPTLPVVAFQVFALKAYDEFIVLLNDSNPLPSNHLPPDRMTLLKTKRVDGVIQDVRNIFLKDPALAGKMRQKIRESEELSDAAETGRLIKSLIRMYTSEGGFYLNLYGPAGTITTIPYHEILSPPPRQARAEKRFDFNGKAVFIGRSEISKPTKESFHTPFDTREGVRIDGVEVAATVFANLLEDRVVKPPGFFLRVTVIVIIGMTLGILCYLLSPFLAAFGVVVLCILYTSIAWYLFKVNALWLPLVTPVFFQALFAYTASVIWTNRITRKERETIRKAFGYYLPDRMVDQITREMPDPKRTGKTVYGTCLFTDAEDYVPKSENMSPLELQGFLNQYFEVIFHQVKRHDGIVQDIKGDEILAVWTGSNPDLNIRRRACFAALDIADAVDEFNRKNRSLELPTRIGLHSGTIFLGSIGAIDHYEYRAIGGIVNTASRIENLNKHLGTKKIISTEVLEQLEGFLTRELGYFQFAGKSIATQVHELIGRKEAGTDFHRIIWEHFKNGLNAYRTQLWEEAVHYFRECLKLDTHDGPSLFYLEKCENYLLNPPTGDWSGEILV
ncbi:MAG: adenylate/guanylate cyclase domain-containing protein [Deltaproteobacteria bacterium]|nr:adenylate/guanylate cyclase domain-containing protein [Deltaproteobacteria bacterium]